MTKRKMLKLWDERAILKLQNKNMQIPVSAMIMVPSSGITIVLQWLQPKGQKVEGECESLTMPMYPSSKEKYTA